MVLTSEVAAKKLEIYRCTQTDGTVVVQDRRCMITDLHQNKANKQKKSQVNQRTRNQSTPSSKRQTKLPAQISKRSIDPNDKKASGRSPYFNAGWDRYLPANWARLKANSNNYQQLYLSRAQLKTTNDFKHGVKLSVYSDTMKASGLDSFAKALQLYHQIRDNGSFQLLDSQFKAHPNYKVFNIKYQNHKQQMLLTEFYIDEQNNDLFVVTIQAAPSNWQTNQTMAEKIISQL